MAGRGGGRLYLQWRGGQWGLGVRGGDGERGAGGERGDGGGVFYIISWILVHLNDLMRLCMCFKGYCEHLASEYIKTGSNCYRQ